MDIGVARENRPGEKRVVLLPANLKDIAAEHEVFVEKGAGEGLGIADNEYERSGARVADRSAVYARSLVVRIKEPKEEELALMKPGSAILSMLHLSSFPRLRALLEEFKITAIAMEEIRDPFFGRRMIEALHQTGYLAMEKGFELWGKDPSECAVKIIGYGNVSYGAIQCAARKLAKVVILNKRDYKNMREHIPGTDIMVNAVNWPPEKQGKEFIITRDMLKLFKDGAIILDLISNIQGHSPVESMRPTNLVDIAYEVDGVVHASCWGWPGLDPENITRRYSIQVTPIIRQIARRGLDDLPEHIEKASYFPGKKRGIKG